MVGLKMCSVTAVDKELVLAAHLELVDLFIGLNGLSQGSKVVDGDRR